MKSDKAAHEFQELLRERFEKQAKRHAGLAWREVEVRLERSPNALRSLREMERSGGEPDVLGRDRKSGEVIFADFAAESPKARRSLCYDAAALSARKEHKPKGSAVATAAAMGATLLTEEQYREMQRLGEFDLKTSSWIYTPPNIRELGGALFCDRRFDTVFTYHNGAESYYAGRGFRCALRV